MKKLSFQFVKKSFSVRLILLFVVLTLFTVLAMNYYIYGKFRNELRNDLVEHGQSLTRLLAQTSRLGVFTGSSQELRGPADIIFQELQCERVLIYDWEGEVLVSLGSAVPEGNDALFGSRALYDKFSRTIGTTVTLYPEHNMVLFGQPIFSEKAYSYDDLFMGKVEDDTALQKTPDAEAIGYVVVVLSTKEMQAKSKHILLYNLLVSFVALLLSSVFIVVTVRKMTKPLETLAREIVKHKTTDAENGEIDLFSDFGRMISIIQESYSKIVDLKENLEKKVRHRTEDLVQQKYSLFEANCKLEESFKQLQKAQLQIIQTEKMVSVGLMVSGLSHEIKNSINFISSSLPLLKENMQIEAGAEGILSKSEAKRKENIRILFANIDEGVRRTVKVVEDLGNFSHEYPADFRDSDILLGLKSSVALVQHEYKNRIDFQEEYTCEHLVVCGDQGQLNQIFMNVLLNAVQSIVKTGRIVVRAWQDNGKALISITDSGVGIDPEIKEKLFDPFFTTKDVGQGSGLGLSISYSIIQKHGGEITVANAPDQGAVFTILLPLKGN